MASSAENVDSGASAEAIQIEDNVLVELSGASQPQTAQPATANVVRLPSRKRLGKGVLVSTTKGSVDSATEDPGIKARISCMGTSNKLLGRIVSGNSKTG